MMKSVSPSEIRGDVVAPPSKSVMLRAVAAAFLSEETVTIINPSRSEDAEAALRIIGALGARVDRGEDRILVERGPGPLRADLDCGESGLCARMFTPIAALLDRLFQLTGRGSLLGRPLGPIEAPLAKLGADCITKNGYLPLTVKGPLVGGRARVDASLGSQFLTGLLLALPRAPLNSEISVSQLTSLSYIRLTLNLLAAFGIAVSHQDFRTFRIEGRQKFRARDYRVEGDWSGAAFIIVAAALTGEVTLRGLDSGSPQGDRAILDVVARAGANVSVSAEAVHVARGELRAFEFDVTHCPDLAPPLVVLAARASGTSLIRGADRLVHKESDRAETLIKEFRSLGVDLRREGNGLIIRGGAVGGGAVNSHGDHRIAMAAAVAALAAQGAVTIDGAECVRKSYPGFFEDLRRLGGRIHE